MTLIRPTSDLRNRFNEISELCQRTGEPVFITRNGVGHMVVMSHERYEALEAEMEGLRKAVAKAVESPSPPRVAGSGLPTRSIKSKADGDKVSNWQLSHRIQRYG